ncbi:MAG: hypothetical protein LBN98_01385 [Prevotellaceae bacterium]|nr:hypothetical protein [Prevotellaceae bacterium]
MSPGCSASCRNAATAKKLLRDAFATLRRRKNCFGTLSQRCEMSPVTRATSRYPPSAKEWLRAAFATLRNVAGLFGVMSQRCDGDKIASGRLRNAATASRTPAGASPCAAVTYRPVRDAVRRSCPAAS